jgi:hypothetical protein
LVEAASQVEVALHELVKVIGWPAWKGPLYGQHSCAVPLLRHNCPLAAVQVPLTVVPPGLVMVACPPGLKVTVSVTPFVVT